MIPQSVVPGMAMPSMVKSLSQSCASGVLICVAENCEKRLTFWHGRLTGAASNLIDDRMGEVIYRAGMISVDDFVETAAKVNQKTRFGEALVRSGVFNELNLWDALNLQFREVLMSLCFYSDLQVRFEDMSTPPRAEYLLQFDVAKLLTRAVAEVEVLTAFQNACKLRPILELDAFAQHLVINDFMRDLVGLIQKNPNYDDLLNKESRLSGIYTARALFDLYSRGVLKDTLLVHKKMMREETLALLANIVEQSNFMFAELRAAALADNVDTWAQTIAFVNQALQRALGVGVFVRPEEGFILENIARACVCQFQAREWVTSNPSSNRWLDVVANAIQDILYGAVLQIIFELQNRQFNSQNLARARSMVEKMRYQDMELL